MTTTDIALPSEQNAEKPSLAAYLKAMMPEIQRALPRGMDADRVARLALTVVRQSEMQAQASNRPQMSLTACSPASFAGALMTAAALGLEPGVNGEAYLVPYKRECQLIIGYQGYAKLFWQNPLARHIDAQAVYANDEFDYAYGTEPFLRHKPANGDRGDLIAYYAVATLSTGGSSFVVLSPDEVKKLRGGKVGTSGNIDDPMRWMERKTALRQLIKTLPRSTMLNHALVADEAFGTSLRAQRAADQITGSDEPVDDFIEGEQA